MTRFAHTDFPTEHRGVTRAEAAIAAAGQLSQGFKGTRGMAALLLAAVVSTVLVLAERLVDSGSGLLAAWLVTWVALVLFAAPARRLAAALVRGLDGWSAAIAEARADQRTWALARADARVMGELQAAMLRNEPAPAESTPDLRKAVPSVGAVRSYYFYL